MISTIMLYQLDMRLRQAKPECADKPFGGKLVILSGDFRNKIQYFLFGQLKFSFEVKFYL